MANEDITIITAIFAVILGIYNAYVHWRDKQPSIEVKVQELHSVRYSLGDSKLEDVIVVYGYNKGQIPIVITNLFFFFSKDNGFSLGRPYQTKVLPGTRCERWTYSDEIAKELRKGKSSFFSDDRLDHPLSGIVKVVAQLRISQ